jgi:two-component system sensor histidine kinase KdpD
MNNERPNPDQLLARVEREKAKARRGRLKIFFGAVAGVGKTYAMLLAARERRSENIDIIVGLVETHGRKETAALMEGLEVLPPKQIDYRETTLQEFDLDAALKRKPSIILVDELAHSNAQGCRHPKRWQDIEELLDAGIDVYTALNVQHLESLNDDIGQISGIRVGKPCRIRCLKRPMKSNWWTCRPTNCSLDSKTARFICRNRPRKPLKIFSVKAI